ncbi:MAG: DUF447 family protein [Promethearchaeota archaeon]|nr:MAG: DUF447 family protein [Candidatus Lokiarchaeota archaeon]
MNNKLELILLFDFEYLKFKAKNIFYNPKRIKLSPKIITFKEKFGIEKDHLYEILATTISINKDTEEIFPNTSSMGIRLKENNLFVMNPYPSTKTFQNLEANGIVMINFVDNIYLYALAALKEPESRIGLKIFPKRYYEYLDNSMISELQNYLSNQIENAISNIPYIKQSWGIIIGMVEGKKKKEKQNGLGKINLTEFKINPIYSNNLRASYNLYNRAENLALEMIILATRLKVAYIKEDRILISSIEEKISQFENDIRRFSKNSRVLKTINLVQKYRKTLEIP